MLHVELSSRPELRRSVVEGPAVLPFSFQTSCISRRRLGTAVCGRSALTEFRNLLLGISLVLSPLTLCAQAGTYSGSPEYQKMLEELHTPAPSLAYIATGQRQLADQALPVRVRDKGGLLQLRTKALEITVDKSRATLTLVNLLTNANWLFSFAPMAPAQAVSIQRQQNTWSIATAGGGTLKVEFLHPSLVRITSAGPGSPKMPAEGTAPIFGVGKRFSQAALAAPHLDVRPADKSGEPGHNWVYVAIPLVYTPTGLGLYADTIFDTHFRFNQAGCSVDFETANHAVSFYLMSGADGKAILEQ